MGRRRLFLLVCTFFLTFGPTTTPEGRAVSLRDVKTEPAKNSASPAELVRRLGDGQFAARNRAMRAITQLGVAAIPALEEGVQSRDRETSYRSAHALKIIREVDFQRRLQAFAVGEDAEESYQLPGWVLFRKSHGDQPVVRSLFVAMQKSEPKLLEIMEQSPSKAREALLVRVDELQYSSGALVSVSAPLGTLAAVLFAINQQQTPLPSMTVKYVATLYRQQEFAIAIQSGAYRDILKTMLGTWIARGEGWDVNQAIHMALQYGIPEGLVTAKKILDGDVDDVIHPYARCYALLAFAKFGDESHIPVIDPFLEDTTQYAGPVKTGANVKFRPQIRDVALAALVHLTQQDHRAFGFERLIRNPNHVFDTTSVAFEDDTKREEAIKKWRAYRADQRP